jgi:hypothetical protein
MPIRENTICRRVHEALANALKHGQAERIRVQIALRGEVVWANKRQPTIEKRFARLKTDFEVALVFRRIARRKPR